MHVRRNTQLKSFAKFIKHAKSHVHYTLPDLYALYMSAKLILINAKTTSIILLESVSAGRIKEKTTAKAVQNKIPPRRAA